MIASGASTNADKIRGMRSLLPAGLSGLSERLAGSATIPSGPGPSDEAAKPALAAAIFRDRSFQSRAVKIGPIGWHENQFAISRLPQQKIRQPLLAAGPDDDIGIGQVGSVEVISQSL